MMKYFKERKIRKLSKKINVLFKNRQTNAVNNATLAREIALYMQLAVHYDKLVYNKHFPNAKEYALENYRQAAGLEDVKALEIVGERTMNMGKFLLDFDDSIYASPIHRTYADVYFAESLACLNSANSAGSVMGKRFLGVLHINGWGVEQNVDHGAGLLVESIEAEGAWEKASEIFTELGLNKPEFFTKLMSLKGGR